MARYIVRPSGLVSKGMAAVTDKRVKAAMREVLPSSPTVHRGEEHEGRRAMAGHAGMAVSFSARTLKPDAGLRKVLNAWREVPGEIHSPPVQARSTSFRKRESKAPKGRSVYVP